MNDWLIELVVEFLRSSTPDILAEDEGTSDLIDALVLSIPSSLSFLLLLFISESLLFLFT